MRLHTNNLALRIGATVIAFGWAAFGWFSISMSNQAPSPELADRALWMGITLLIAAGIALPVSWAVKDLSNIWCIPAKKTPLQRINDTDDKRP